MFTLFSRLEYLSPTFVQVVIFIKANTMIIGEYFQFLDKNNQNFVDLLSKEFDMTGRDLETTCNIAEKWILSF